MLIKNIVLKNDGETFTNVFCRILPLTQTKVICINYVNLYCACALPSGYYGNSVILLSTEQAKNKDNRLQAHNTSHILFTFVLENIKKMLQQIKTKRNSIINFLRNEYVKIIFEIKKNIYSDIQFDVLGNKPFYINKMTYEYHSQTSAQKYRNLL